MLDLALASRADRKVLLIIAPVRFVVHADDSVAVCQGQMPLTTMIAR